MQSLDVQEAYTLLQNNEAVMIDVREQEEYDQAHIEGVIFVPLSTLPQKIQNVDFENFKNKKIIFQCLKGGRSAQAIEYLQDTLLQGHDVYNLTGGIAAWEENSLPIVTPNDAA